MEFEVIWRSLVGVSILALSLLALSLLALSLSLSFVLSLMSLVHRWIITIFYYVVRQNMLYILIERIVIRINEL